MKLLNFSELSRHITKGDRNAIRVNKIPRKWWGDIDTFIYRTLPDWWEEKKQSIGGKQSEHKCPVCGSDKTYTTTAIHCTRCAVTTKN
jgi:hypothetical protein